MKRIIGLTGILSFLLLCFIACEKESNNEDSDNNSTNPPGTNTYNRDLLLNTDTSVVAEEIIVQNFKLEGSSISASSITFSGGQIDLTRKTFSLYNTDGESFHIIFEFWPDSIGLFDLSIDQSYTIRSLYTDRPGKEFDADRGYINILKLTPNEIHVKFDLIADNNPDTTRYYGEVHFRAAVPTCINIAPSFKGLKVEIDGVEKSFTDDWQADNATRRYYAYHGDGSYFYLELNSPVTVPDKFGNGYEYSLNEFQVWYVDASGENFKSTVNIYLVISCGSSVRIIGTFEGTFTNNKVIGFQSLEMTNGSFDL